MNKEQGKQEINQELLEACYEGLRYGEDLLRETGDNSIRDLFMKVIVKATER